MRGRIWRTGLCVLALAVYAVAGLSSRRFDPQPPWIENGVVPAGDGGLLFLAPGSARAAGPPEWVPEVIRDSSFELTLEARSFVERQYGPARIFTISLDTGHRNLTVGQQGGGLVVRLRTVATDDNGLPAFEIPDVFADGEVHRIAVTVDGGSLHLAVDGDPARRISLPDHPLRNWDPAYPLLLGNEEGGRRPWLGEIHRATVRVKERKFEYADPQALIIPEYVQLRGSAPESIEPAGGEARMPLSANTRAAIHDAAKNLCGFIPLGLMLVLLWRRLTLPWVMMACGLFSLLIEAAQVVVPGRYPHFADFLLNVLGGVLGALLGRTILAAVRSRTAAR